MDNIVQLFPAVNGSEISVRMGSKLRAEILRRIHELETQHWRLTTLKRRELAGMRQLATIPERAKEPMSW